MRRFYAAPATHKSKKIPGGKALPLSIFFEYNNFKVSGVVLRVSEDAVLPDVADDSAVLLKALL